MSLLQRKLLMAGGGASLPPPGGTDTAFVSQTYNPHWSINLRGYRTDWPIGTLSGTDDIITLGSLENHHFWSDDEGVTWSFDFKVKSPYTKAELEAAFTGVQSVETGTGTQTATFASASDGRQSASGSDWLVSWDWNYGFHSWSPWDDGDTVTTSFYF